MKVYLLRWVNGRNSYHVAATLDENVCNGIKARIEARPPKDGTRGSLEITSISIIESVEQYEKRRIEREAEEAINGLYGKEKTAIVAYIEQLRESSQPMPLNVEGNNYEQK